MSKTRWLLTLGLVAAGVLPQLALAKSWSQEYIGSLPDSAFASVETAADGKKLRHLPYRDASGQVDAPHLRSALMLWSHVKWENKAQAQPALAKLKAVKVALCHEGKIKCAASSKTAKIKKAKTGKPRAKRSVAKAKRA